MNITHEESKDYVAKNKKHLARILRRCDADALTVVDTSATARRRIRNPVEYQALGLDQIWDIEAESQRDFQGVLEGKISVPMWTRREYGAGLTKLRGMLQDPLEALRERWGAPLPEIPSYDSSGYSARDKLGKFLEEGESLLTAFRNIPTEEYMNDVDEESWRVFFKTRPIVREIANDIKKNWQGPHKPRGDNDADIFTMSYTLAHRMPVQILTADPHFLKIHQRVYEVVDKISQATDYPTPAYSLNIIMDRSKRPQIQRADYAAEPTSDVLDLVVA